jgi:type III secretion protein U
MSEKTEQPTDKKLREARDRGEVAKSKDFTQTVLITALFAYVVANSESIVSDLSRILILPIDLMGGDFRASAEILLGQFIRESISLLWPFLAIVLVVGIFAETIQTGVLFAFEAIKPSAKKLDIVSNAQNMFSKKNLVEFLKNNLKVIVLCVVVWILVHDSLSLLMFVPDRGIEELGSLVGQLLKKMIVYVGITYLALSLADLVFQRKMHTKQLMMSKDEVKQEYKTMEGDPHVKGHRRQLYMELLSEGAVDRSRTASVIITNPTHLAIALLYDEANTPLPMVVGKGEGLLAERMIAAAREAGVPVMQDIPVARALFEYAEVDQYIPSDLIEPVAAVLRLVRRLGSSSDNARPT